ncbi:MAG: hypothetical protein ACTSRH_00655 [Promethearchaeota archaeon]
MTTCCCCLFCCIVGKKKYETAEFKNVMRRIEGINVKFDEDL